MKLSYSWKSESLAEDMGIEKTDHGDSGCSEESELGRVARATMTAYIPPRDDSG
jgi:hypothetical protein